MQLSSNSGAIVYKLTKYFIPERIPAKMTVQRRKDAFLFSSPRTLSNLLCHMLSAQPGWAQASYHYHDAFLYAFKEFVKGPEFVTPEVEAEVNKRLEDGFQNMKSDMDKAHSDVQAIFLPMQTDS